MFQDEILAILDNFSVDSISSFDALPPREKHYFLTRLYKCFSAGLRHLGEELSTLRGLKLHYSRDRRTTKFVGTRLEDTFYKKLAFYTSRSVVTCPVEEVSADITSSKSKRMAKRKRYDSATLRSLRSAGKYIFGDVKAHQRTHGGEVHVSGRHYVVDRNDLSELLETILGLREAIKHRLVYILPALPDRQKQLRVALRKGGVVRGNFKRHELVRQFTEENLTPGEPYLDMGLARIYLPHLTGVPLKSIIELREKEARAYADFQIALEDFLCGAQHTPSEERIQDFLRTLDEGIRSTWAALESVQREWKMAKQEILVKFIVLGFVVLAPELVAKTIAPFIGTITAFDYLKSNREFRQRKHEATAGEFYVAWKLSELGR